MEYPKALYMRGWLDLTACVTVDDARGEAAARADGYRHLAEPEPEVIPVMVERPAMQLVPEHDDEAPARLRGRPRKAD